MGITVVEQITLDGVMERPEDWSPQYQDQVFGEYMASHAGQGEGALLLGRRTYDALSAFWPTAPAELPFTELINRQRKDVVSSTLTEPLEWNNSHVISFGDVPARAAETSLVVLGSAELTQGLLAAGLVDELLLTIHPLVLGTGKRVFADGGAPASLALAETLPTTTGVIIARYARA